MRKEVIIVGGGFAGLAAAREVDRAGRHGDGVRVRLFDPNPYTTMIPSLPDLAGGRFAERYLTERFDALLPRSIAHCRERVTAVDFTRREVATDAAVHRYDHLVLGAGSVTNFFGFDQHREAVCKLDTIDDANRIAADFADYLRAGGKRTAVVAGAGYTGLELACNLQYAGRAVEPRPRVIVVELAERILPMMPDRVREYLGEKARRRGLELITRTSVQAFDGANVTLSNGRRIEDAFLCWATGTKFAIGDLSGNHEQIKDGRLVVDVHLRLPQHPEVFAAGDAAAVESGGRVLRKAVNFARDSGRQAGRNVVLALRGRTLDPFRPVDLGWVIPFGDVGVGTLFGRLRVRGRLPLALHYGMCGLRNYNLRNLLFYWKTGCRALLSQK